jgi:hypothetical protein
MPDTIKNLCIVLKLIWEDTADHWNKLNLAKLLKDEKLLYAGVLPTVLREKKILEFKRSLGWHWISTTEPNEHMATELVKACKDYIARHTYHDAKSPVTEEKSDFMSRLFDILAVDVYGKYETPLTTIVVKSTIKNICVDNKTETILIQLDGCDLSFGNVSTEQPKI